MKGRSQIMPNNMETQHKHMYLKYIGSLCNIVFSMYNFTGILITRLNEDFDCIEA